LIKSDMRGVGARAGISGVVETRFVHTDDIGNPYRFGSAAGLTGPIIAGFVPATTVFPTPSSGTGLTRYRGVQTFPGGGAGAGVTAVGTVSAATPGVAPLPGPAQFDHRDFFSVSNFSLNIDREFDPHTHFHAQIGINAEGSTDADGFPFGTGAG